MNQINVKHLRMYSVVLVSAELPYWGRCLYCSVWGVDPGVGRAIPFLLHTTTFGAVVALHPAEFVQLLSSTPVNRGGIVPSSAAAVTMTCDTVETLIKNKSRRSFQECASCLIALSGLVPVLWGNTPQLK